MRATIEAGATIEFASPAEVEAIVRQHTLARTPLLLRVKAAGLAPTSGVLVLTLGWPFVGRVWNVQHIVASQADPTVSVTGKVFVCVGKTPSIATILGTDPIDPFAVQTATNLIPSDANFGRHECVVHHQDTLYVVYSGVTAGTQMIAHALVVDEHESEEANYPA